MPTSERKIERKKKDEIHGAISRPSCIFSRFGFSGYEGHKEVTA